MKLATFATADGTRRFGAVHAGGLVELGNSDDDVNSLHALIARDLLGSAREALALTTVADYRLEDVTFLPPITAPEKILCIGVNYVDRNEEYRDGAPEAAYPSVFMRTAASLTGYGAPILRPPESDQLDYEGEIAIVIGRAGRRIPRERAHEHIFGLTCMNEGTLRDWVRHAKFNVTQGKNFTGSGAVGPWIATADEFDDMNDLTVTTRVNGEVRQHDTTANLRFDFAYLIAYLSTFTELAPGDLIATGTPTGAGARFDPPRYLVPGDTVEVEVQGVGVLRNTVADE